MLHFPYEERAHCIIYVCNLIAERGAAQDVIAERTQSFKARVVLAQCIGGGTPGVTNGIDAVVEQLFHIAGIVYPPAPVIQDELVVGVGIFNVPSGSSRKGTVPPLWQRAQFPGWLAGRNP